MNVICSSCVGARIYEYYKKLFNNPFMWCLIDGNNFINLIKEYNNINFSNFSISVTHKSRNTFVIYDNKINTMYPHYIYNKNINGIIKQNLDVTGDDILNYVTNTLNRRISRFNITEDDIFIFDDKTTYNISYTDAEIILFLDLHTNHSKILLTDKEEFKNYRGDNITVIYYTKNLNSIERAKLIINYYENKKLYNNTLF